MAPICEEIKSIAAKCGYVINGDTIQDLLREFNKAIDAKTVSAKSTSIAQNYSKKQRDNKD